MSSRDVATHSMLGSEQGDEIDLRAFVQYVYGRSQVVVHTGRIGDQPYAFTFEAFEVALAKYLNPGFHFGMCCGGYDDCGRK